MKSRFIVGIIIAVIMVTAVILSGINVIIFDIFAIALMVMAGYEMTKAFSEKYAVPLKWLIYSYPFIGYGVYIGGGFIPFLGGLNAVFILNFILILALAIASKTTTGFNKSNATSTIFVLLYPMTLLMFLLACNRIGATDNPLFFDRPYGVTPLAMVFLISSLSDTFAYFVGSLLKGPKLIPKISPKKTVSGAIGGLIGGMLGATIGVVLGYYNILGTMAINSTFVGGLVHVLILGIVGSVFTQAGDLLASVVKRKLDIKDYGTLLKGHGGIMDRIDGQILNAVFVYFYFVIFMML